MIYVPKCYGKDTDLLNAVTDCNARRLLHAEAVKQLNARGFKINEKKYQRILSYIRKTIPERLADLPNKEYQESIIESIDTINSMINLYWEMVNEATDKWQKSQILAMILNCLVTKEKFYESSPVVAALASKIKKNQENVSEKSK